MDHTADLEPLRPPVPVPVPVAVLISGGGSNMAALLYASRFPGCPYRIVLVAANDPAAGGLALAAAEGVPTFALSHRGMTRAAHEAAMEAEIVRHGAERIALAGYMRVLTPDFVARWEGRMVNVHPSLLPKYPGLDTHARALAAGDSHAGCTVHEVTGELDAGPILGQSAVAVLPGDTPERLAARVLLAEHQLYARCVAAWVTREASLEWLTARVRTAMAALPAVEETVSHGMACFGVSKGRKFAYVSSNGHTSTRVALLVRITGADEQAMLIGSDPARYFRPPYYGDLWIGQWLDGSEVDWDAITARLATSWTLAAPKRLAAVFGG